MNTMNKIYNKILLVPLIAIFALLSFGTVLAAAPAATNDVYTVNEDTTLTVAAAGVLTNDTDADNDPLTAVLDTAPTKGSLALNANGGFTYTPNANFNGADTFKYKANDGALSSAAATVTITVNSVNDAPVLTTPTQVSFGAAGTEHTYQVNATDVDTGASLTYTFDAKGWTTFSADATGLAKFTPLDADVGLHTITVTVSDGTANATKDVTFFVTESCDDASLMFSGVDINDETGDDTETVPGDYLSLEFDVQNKISKDYSNVKTKAWLQNSDGVRVGSKVETGETDIGSKDSVSESLKLQVAPTAKVGTHTVFMRAEGDDEDGNTKCAVYAKSVSIKKNSHELLVDNVVLSPTAPVCSGKVQVSATVYNIGSTTEDDIKLRVRNTQMNVDVYSDMFELKTSGSSQKSLRSVIIDLPAGAKGTYNTEVSVLFNGGADSATTTVNIPVTCEGAATTTTGTTTTAGKATISIPVTSASAESGQTVKFTVTLTNAESTDASYNLQLAGVSDWSTSNIEPTDVSLAPGASLPVYVYLTPKAGYYGAQSATLTVNSGTTTVATKTLTVNLPEKATTTVRDLGHAASGQAFDDNTKIAIIAAALIIAAGFVFSRYRARVEVYGEKSGKKRREEE